MAGVQFTLFVWLLTGSSEEWVGAFERTMHRLLEAAFDELNTVGDLQALAMALATPLLWPTMKAGIWLVAGRLVLHLASTELGLAPGKLAPDFKRLNGFARLPQLPRQNAAQAMQALIALPVFGYLCFSLVAGHAQAFQRLMSAGVRAAAVSVASALSEVLWYGASLLLVLTCSKSLVY